MTRTEDVILAFFPTWKWSNTVALAELAHCFTAPCENFVGIGLMTYIPDQSIRWCLKDIVQGDGQLNDSQSCAEVTPSLAHGV